MPKSLPDASSIYASQKSLEREQQQENEPPKKKKGLFGFSKKEKKKSQKVICFDRKRDDTDDQPTPVLTVKVPPQSSKPTANIKPQPQIKVDAFAENKTPPPEINLNTKKSHKKRLAPEPPPVGGNEKYRPLSLQNDAIIAQCGPPHEANLKVAKNGGIAYGISDSGYFGSPNSPESVEHEMSYEIIDEDSVMAESVTDVKSTPEVKRKSPAPPRPVSMSSFGSYENESVSGASSSSLKKKRKAPAPPPPKRVSSIPSSPDSVRQSVSLTFNQGVQSKVQDSPNTKRPCAFVAPPPPDTPPPPDILPVSTPEFETSAFTIEVDRNRSVSETSTSIDDVDKMFDNVINEAESIIDDEDQSRSVNTGHSESSVEISTIDYVQPSLHAEESDDDGDYSINAPKLVTVTSTPKAEAVNPVLVVDTPKMTLNVDEPEPDYSDMDISRDSQQFELKDVENAFDAIDVEEDEEVINMSKPEFIVKNDIVNHIDVHAHVDVEHGLDKSVVNQEVGVKKGADIEIPAFTVDHRSDSDDEEDKNVELKFSKPEVEIKHDVIDGGIEAEVIHDVEIEPPKSEVGAPVKPPSPSIELDVKVQQPEVDNIEIEPPKLEVEAPVKPPTPTVELDLKVEKPKVNAEIQPVEIDINSEIEEPSIVIPPPEFSAKASPPMSPEVKAVSNVFKDPAGDVPLNIGELKYEEIEFEDNIQPPPPNFEVESNYDIPSPSFGVKTEIKEPEVKVEKDLKVEMHPPEVAPSLSLPGRDVNSPKSENHEKEVIILSKKDDELDFEKIRLQAKHAAELRESVKIRESKRISLPPTESHFRESATFAFTSKSSTGVNKSSRPVTAFKPDDTPVVIKPKPEPIKKETPIVKKTELNVSINPKPTSAPIKIEEPEVLKSSPVILRTSKTPMDNSGNNSPRGSFHVEAGATEVNKVRLKQLKQNFESLQNQFKHNQEVLTRHSMLMKTPAPSAQAQKPSTPPPSTLPKPLGRNSPVPNGGPPKAPPVPSAGAPKPPPAPSAPPAPKINSDRPPSFKPPKMPVQQKNDSRFGPKKDPRDEFLDAIRNHGGRSNLRKVGND